MQSYGQHPAPQMSLLHISDTHLLGSGEKLFGVLETESLLDQLFDRVHASGVDIAAVVFTGDLADLGTPDAYRHLRTIVEPRVNQLGAQLVWVMGNHDEREAFSSVLLDEAPTSEPQDRVYDLGGLRLIVLDTSVPGYHHGQLLDGQLAWLADQLAHPAPLGTLIAMHHPPIPTPVDLMAVIELEDQGSFWRVVKDRDVRGVLAGHLHYSTFTALHGIPVSVASAMCYTIDLFGSADRLLVSANRGQTASLVTVWPEQVVFSHLPAERMPEIHGFSADYRPMVDAMSPEERREVLSNKTSDFNVTMDR